MDEARRSSCRARARLRPGFERLTWEGGALPQANRRTLVRQKLGGPSASKNTVVNEQRGSPRTAAAEGARARNTASSCSRADWTWRALTWTTPYSCPRCARQLSAQAAVSDGARGVWVLGARGAADTWASWPGAAPEGRTVARKGTLLGQADAAGGANRPPGYGHERRSGTTLGAGHGAQQRERLARAASRRLEPLRRAGRGASCCDVAGCQLGCMGGRAAGVDRATFAILGSAQHARKDAKYAGGPWAVAVTSLQTDIRLPLLPCGHHHCSPRAPAAGAYWHRAAMLASCGRHSAVAARPAASPHARTPAPKRRWLLPQTAASNTGRTFELLMLNLGHVLLYHSLSSPPAPGWPPYGPPPQPQHLALITVCHITPARLLPCSPSRPVSRLHSSPLLSCFLAALAALAALAVRRLSHEAPLRARNLTAPVAALELALEPPEHSALSRVPRPAGRPAERSRPVLAAVPFGLTAKIDTGLLRHPRPQTEPQRSEPQPCPGSCLLCLFFAQALRYVVPKRQH
ncbi:hypothetical protein P154DRAFT_571779 [Amniculicola lignicola CBS 123094]|uniref:Uncharacterized protein n=1 Tax=Amniculicola lignicola CBS 123094 TaxID=1392246 RepID=A0A6A5WWP2_9PLEO|nr:hypothetical protein P154DRAFT_571779 [Amniculicola lignicola CBS 123094]